MNEIDFASYVDDNRPYVTGDSIEELIFELICLIDFFELIQLIFFLSMLYVKLIFICAAISIILFEQTLLVTY